jgi:branched-chain amino acid aminotransferase
MTFPIEIKRVKQSRIKEVDFSDLPFGKHYTDHMFMAEYRDGAWGNSRIVPFGDLSLSPATSFIHYGQSIFEGIKAYKNAKGEPLLFRPDQNLKRMNLSAARMGMPELPADLFTESINELVYMERDWIPTLDGSSLYIRPFMFAADEFIGIRPTEEFNYMVITSPSGRYYPKPVMAHQCCPL